MTVANVGPNVAFMRATPALSCLAEWYAGPAAKVAKTAAAKNAAAAAAAAVASRDQKEIATLVTAAANTVKASESAPIAATAVATATVTAIAIAATALVTADGEQSSSSSPPVCVKNEVNGGCAFPLKSLEYTRAHA
jgi:hypothetical protein